MHNEEDLIPGLLGRLERDSVIGDYEVIVACNACSDRSAELARSVPGVVVDETLSRGKAAGLNLGDSIASTYPRIYMDADVRISKEALDAVVDVLDAGIVLAAAPRVEVDLERCPWAVRAYYKVWSALPWSIEEMVGSGIYAASREGRERFGSFPDDPGLADDLYFSAQFAPSERMSLEEFTFQIPASSSLRSLISRKARILTINAHTAGYISDLPGRPTGGRKSTATVLMRRELWPAALVYVGVAGLSKLAAAYRVRKGNFTWTGRQRG